MKAVTTILECANEAEATELFDDLLKEMAVGVVKSDRETLTVWLREPEK